MKFKKIDGTQNQYLFKPFGSNGELRDVFWLRYSRVGRGRLEESLKTNILSDARIERDKRIAEFLGTKIRWKGKALLVEDKFPEFIELKKVKSIGTQNSIRFQWVHLKEFFGGMLIDEVTNTAWLKYVAKKREKHPERKFFNDRKYLTMFLKWLNSEGLLDRVPKFDDVDPEVDAGAIYEDDEIETLFQCCTHQELLDQMTMAYTMFMRHAEIYTLEWTQIDWSKKTVHLPAEKTKIRKSRTFVMSEPGEVILRRRFKEKVSAWVFPHPVRPEECHGRYGTKSQWDKLREDTGIEGRFHDWRHTALTKAFKESVNPALICNYAGLSLEEAYRTYLHFTPEDTKLISKLVRLP